MLMLRLLHCVCTHPLHCITSNVKTSNTMQGDYMHDVLAVLTLVLLADGACIRQLRLQLPCPRLHAEGLVAQL